MRGLQLVLFREGGDQLRCEAVEHKLRDLAEKRVAQAVDSLESLEEQQQFLEVGDAKFFVHLVKRMCNGMGDVVLRQVFLQVVDILAQALDFAVLRLVDSPHEQMHLAAVLGEIGRHLLADECARLVRDFEATLDAVVVGDGDEIHPARAKQVVEFPGLGIAVGKIEPARDPFRGAVAEAGMDVEVNFRHCD